MCGSALIQVNDIYTVRFQQDNSVRENANCTNTMTLRMNKDMKNGDTKTPQDKIKQAVKRYLAGEPAAELAKEYKVSRPGFYLWIKKHKEELVELAKRSNMSAESIDKSDKINTAIENQALKAEVVRLKQKLFELMDAAGKL